MEKLFIKPTHITPEIILSPDENKFSITGVSSPEDVRALYYPVTEWLEKFLDEIRRGDYRKFSEADPLTFRVDLSYFNSASAKFLFDILLRLKNISEAGVTVVTEWYYEEDDIDMKEAGEDISELVKMELKYIIKPS